MSPTVVRWRTHGPAWFAPVRITCGGTDLVMAPGEPADLPDGPFEARADVPGYLPLTVRGRTPPSVLDLDPGDLRPDPRAAVPVAPPRGLAVDIVPWERGSPSRAAFEVARAGRRLDIRQRAAAPVPAGLRVASPVTPYRLLAMPPAGASEPYRVTWYQAPDSTRRPRIEPADDGGRIIMEYLLASRRELAAAAARAVDRDRGAADPMAWVVPSYTQLLIGYAYALARDTQRLRDWCLRTAAPDELGPDGIVLAAEAAWQRRDPATARQLLARAAGTAQPAVAFGGELAIRLATLLDARAYGRRRTDHRSGGRLLVIGLDDEQIVGGPRPRRVRRVDYFVDPDEDGWGTSDESSRFMFREPVWASSRLRQSRPRPPEPLRPDEVLDTRLARLNTDGLRVLTETDAASAGLSVPGTGERRADLSAAPLWTRLRWRLRYALTGRRHTVVRSRVLRFPIDQKAQEVPVDPITEPEPVGSGRNANATVRLLVSLAGTLGLLTGVYFFYNYWRTTDPLPAFAIGAFAAVVLLGIGATSATAVFQGRLREAEARARVAEARERRAQHSAMRGRALLAVLLADRPRDDDPEELHQLVNRNRRLAEELFGAEHASEPSGDRPGR